MNIYLDKVLLNERDGLTALDFAKFEVGGNILRQKNEAVTCITLFTVKETFQVQEERNMHHNSSRNQQKSTNIADDYNKKLEQNFPGSRRPLSKI